MTRQALFAAVRPFAPDQRLQPDHILLIDAVADAFGLPKAEPIQDAPFSGAVTLRMACEVIGHEAIVQEAYKDSKGVWTWGIGVTSASGHSVERYRDNPQPIERCIEIYLWLVHKKYLPDVLAAFGSYALTEAQAAAALSFHYNTGAIGRADWVRSVRAGRLEAARAEIMNWRSPPEIVERREKERDLFFDGRWANDGTTTVWPVRKPAYTPHWGKGVRVDIREAVKAAMAK